MSQGDSPAMHVVLTPSTDQDLRRRGTENLIRLLEFMDSELERFFNSKRPTMRDMTVPSYITPLFIAGAPYWLTEERRDAWFDRLPKGRGYNADRFCIRELVDTYGHAHLLVLDRSRGASPDDVVIVQDRKLYTSRHGQRGWTGPSVQD